MLIPQSNFHTQEKGQITNIQWSVRYKRRLLRRIFEAVEGLTEACVHICAQVRRSIFQNISVSSVCVYSATLPSEGLGEASGEAIAVRSDRISSALRRTTT